MLFRHDGAEASAAASAAPSGFIVERPAPGLARGVFPTSPAIIFSLGGALLLATLIYYALRLRKPRP